MYYAIHFLQSSFFFTLGRYVVFRERDDPESVALFHFQYARVAGLDWTQNSAGTFMDCMCNSPFSSPRDSTVQNLHFTRQTTDITYFAVVFHSDVIGNLLCFVMFPVL